MKNISDITINSLKKHPENTKPNRLDGNGLSIQEMNTGHTKTWFHNTERIFIGINDNGELIIEDGRYLLEAYRRSNKDIPITSIGFSSNEALSLYNKLM